jgi:hypothetical protein
MTLETYIAFVYIFGHMASVQQEDTLALWPYRKFNWIFFSKTTVTPKWIFQVLLDIPLLIIIFLCKVRLA